MRRLKQTGKSNEAEQELLSASFVSDKYAFSLGPKRCGFSLGPNDAHFTRPKKCAFSLDPKDAHFHLAQKIYVFNRPKIFTFQLSLKDTPLAQPNRCLFSLGPKYVCFRLIYNLSKQVRFHSTKYRPEAMPLHFRTAPVK